MLSLSNIYVQYGNRILLDSVNFVLKPGERVGLVGRNGAGKSTLLKIIAGEMSPHEGNVVCPTHFTLGYLHQDMLMPKGKTVIAETMTAFSEILALEKELRHIENELATREDYESDGYSKLIEQMGDVTDHLHHLGHATTQADAEKVLAGLGFQASDMDRLTDEFSGGWQMRIELAKMLLRQPDLLLLDEPTNHLDIESILWLEDWLYNYPGMVIVISHDRRFLDNVTNRTVEIMTGKIYDYKAPYSKYVELSAERREQMQNAYENQQRVIADKERTITRFMAKASKTKMAQSMQKQLDKLERIEVTDMDTTTMRIRFPDAPRAGEVVAQVEHLTKRYGNLKVLENVDFHLERGERVAFVGQNGQGKTTLAKILIGQEPATSGKAVLGHNVSIGYYAQNQAETLDPKLTLLQTMENNSPEEMRTKLRSILGAFLFSGDEQDRQMGFLSGGERSRAVLAGLLASAKNVLVLDEPSNHLDIPSAERLEDALALLDEEDDEDGGFDGTLLLISHDRALIDATCDNLLVFDGQGNVEIFVGNFTEWHEKHLAEKRAADRRVSEEKARRDDAERRRREAEEAKKQQQQAKKPAAPTFSAGPSANALARMKTEQLEQKIEKIETRMREIDAKVNDPDVWRNPKQANELSAERNKLAAELEPLEFEWARRAENQ